jgi:hypothetical protein
MRPTAVPSKQRGVRDIVLLPSRQDLRADTPDLRGAVIEAVDVLRAEKVITAADDALIALARRYAERIEAAVDLLAEADDVWHAAVQAGEGGLAQRVDRLVRDLEVHELVKQLGSELQKTLESLGATPAARAKLNIKPAEQSGRLKHLREVGGV